MASDVPTFTEKDLKQWKLITDFRTRLEAFTNERLGHPSWEDRRRLLQQADYLSLFLFALANPVANTLRGISAASKLKRVQKEVCTRSVSLGSFSEAQHLVDPAVLEKLVDSLSEQVKGPAPKSPREAWQVWLAQDSSIFRALDRMVWAKHGAGKAGCKNNAVRLHVSFDVWDEKPVRMAVTPGRVCERKIWREKLKEGTTYVGDRYFAEDYKMFKLLEEKHCQFVLRLRDEAVARVEQENPLREEDRAVGVLSDAWVRLGCKERYRTARLRVITVRKPNGATMRLVTNILPEQMTAQEILALYRRRWQIECFFSWIKCLFGCSHFLAESQRGVTIQLYLAVIASLLLHLVLGRRPNKRLWELIQFYLMGMASLEELMAAVDKAVTKTFAKKS